VVPFLKKIAEAAWFQNFIIGVIVFAGVVVGVQTYPSMVETYTLQLHLIDQLILWIFVAEIVIKMGAEGSKPWRYFLDPWNVFDFLIVAVCFMPLENASFVAVLRLARLLRVLKLVRALPKLQVIVSALLKSIPSMFYISVLLGMLFYLYAVLGTFMFQANDPIHFHNLQKAMLSLFRVATLEDWTDVMYINMYGCANYGYDGNEALCTASQDFGWFAAFFFSSFVLLATFIIMNLFIGVIMTGMEEATAEVAALNQDTTGVVPPLYARMASLSEQLAEIQKELHELTEAHKKEA
jgi:voltage-gated sodium channel